MGEECGECETSIENRKPQQFFLSNLWIKNRTVRFRSVERREREREGKMKNLLADGTSFLEVINRYQSLVHQHRENTCDLVAYISLLYLYRFIRNLI